MLSSYTLRYASIEVSYNNILVCWKRVSLTWSIMLLRKFKAIVIFFMLLLILKYVVNMVYNYNICINNTTKGRKIGNALLYLKLLKWHKHFCMYVY